MSGIISSNKKGETVVQVPIFLLMLVVFGIDLVTSLGIAVWVFYLIPLVLCIKQSRHLMPYLCAMLSTGLTIAGYFLSPPGLAPTIAALNRSFGVVTLFGVAYLCQRVIVERLRSERLLWLEQGAADVARSLQGELAVHEVGNRVLHTLTKYVNAQVGTLHRLDGEVLLPCGTYATANKYVRTDTSANKAKIVVGQGLAGEVARHGEIVVLSNVPDNYLRVSSASGESAPRHVLISPITADRQIIGVLEIGFLGEANQFDKEVALLEQVAEKIGIGLRSALYRENQQNLLEETQRQGEELSAQQEELRVANEELQNQSQALQASQAALEIQQSELELSNARLEERAELLEQQKSELLRVQQQLEANAAALEQANRYKSEFLANMSHELRTPLNSSLILSRLLADNKTNTLTEEQVRYARTIHDSNIDLLALINDILDLSKIEAGQVEIRPETVSISSVLESLSQTFTPIAQQKNLAFNISLADDAPTSVWIDDQRLQQILKNLLSNAFKFTHAGEVTLMVTSANADRIRFSVRDTGIGIPEHQQAIIFEAFRQADGSTSRTYGGTGLGLSISRELAHLMGGVIIVESNPGVGSTFTLELPQCIPVRDSSQPQNNVHAEFDQSRAKPTREKPVETRSATPATLPTELVDLPDHTGTFKDDRHNRKHSRLLLIIEDDETFASILCDLIHELQFDCLHATSGAMALKLARAYEPDAILLDVGLPDQSGLTVLERIKRDSATRHIPVHMISLSDHKQTALELGAVGYAIKPVAREEIVAAIQKIEERLDRHVRHILIVEDNATLRESLTEMLGSDGTQITSVGTAVQALEQLAARTFDCMVMDLMLPDASGYDILEKMAKSGRYAFPPVIIYTGRALTQDEEQRLRRYSQSIIIKGARSPERLLDEVSLFLHRVEATLPVEQQQALLKARQRDAALEGRCILLAEDDVRNIFALTSLFEPLGVTLEITRNGKEALERLAKKPAIDLVLMDLMMPEMDGLTAIQEIRKQSRYKRIPIIALTAKAMPDDRQACLNAGASDYIAKPIDVDQLISLCRVWMPK